MAMEHVMLDLETLGTTPGCVILRISAVEFDMETGELGREFNMGISIQSCLDAGLSIDAGTLKWWMEQNEVARTIAFSSDNPLHVTLTHFDLFMVECPNFSVWGNGIRFDAGLLEALYKAIGRKIPFTGWQERDVRTLVSFMPEIKASMSFTGSPHVAIDDCKHQIKYCTAIWKALKPPLKGPQSGDVVKHKLLGLPFTFVAVDPFDKDYAYCFHPYAKQDHDPSNPLRMERVAMNNLVLE